MQKNHILTRLRSPQILRGAPCAPPPSTGLQVQVKSTGYCYCISARFRNFHAKRKIFSRNLTKMPGPDLFSILGPEWQVAGALRSVLFNNSIHSRSGELPQPREKGQIPAYILLVLGHLGPLLHHGTRSKPSSTLQSPQNLLE